MERLSATQPSENAWENFYERIARVARHTLAGYNLSPDFQQEVIQKVAIEIWETQTKDDVHSDSYIAQRLIWRYRDLIRSQPQEQSIEALMESQSDFPLFEQETPESRYLFEEEIQEALADLTLEERMLVQGYRWGYKVQEIAEHLEKSTSWAYKVFRRALRKLQTRR